MFDHPVSKEEVPLGSGRVEVDCLLGSVWFCIVYIFEIPFLSLSVNTLS